MGVKGLWKLLQPVGRPVMLETMEGKALAIDSSIWIYQFQATMRDKEGRGLVNAHVLGFLRRICKLLFYGIKPVFVFDGGAPPLKRVTISERKRKKAGAAASHAQVAEKLLAARMRREALKIAERRRGDGNGSHSPNKAPSGPVVIDENTVFLEDLDNPDPKPTHRETSVAFQDSNNSPTKKKNRWHDHDPYKLPAISEDALSKPTSAIAPDPRLATEEELRAFINEMKPSDFDVTSPEFQELPTEVQYEIIGDLRLKSRQTSYKRLQSMIRSARTAMDFSKAQINGLKQRNNLTQQLLTTTDSIGKAHVQIPIRIASERNKEYVLVKNDDALGGWVLGIRDDGTAAKPIQIDQGDPNDAGTDTDDEGMEEVPIVKEKQSESPTRFDRHPRRHSRSVVAFDSPVTARERTPLFVPELTAVDLIEDDPELQAAIRESLEEQEASQLRQAVEASKLISWASSSPTALGPSTSQSHISGSHKGAYFPDGEDEYLPLHRIPSRLDTALSFANTTPNSSSWALLSEKQLPSTHTESEFATFGKPTLLCDPISPNGSNRLQDREELLESSEDDMETVEPNGLLESIETVSKSPPDVSILTEPETDMKLSSPVISSATPSYANVELRTTSRITLVNSSGRSIKATSELSPSRTPVHSTRLASPMVHYASSSPRSVEEVAQGLPEKATFKDLVEDHDIIEVTPLVVSSDSDDPPGPERNALQRSSESLHELKNLLPLAPGGDEEDHEEDHSKEVDTQWDAAQEIDVVAEEGDFARFVSQIKGRNLDAVRDEIEEEIRTLNSQKKVAMRDSEDITQQMISQIMVMLRLFGIPYITAPMEAEAQCAELVALGLVEGVITDDSDVFLFGGTKVLKNLFNQSQTVECFLLNDLGRDLGLERDKLICLAYLLGSDYVEGLPGVGPVIAMEIMQEFPGKDGLHKFKDWWRKVQSEKDNSSDDSPFRRRFKKRFKDLFLPEDWPNPAVRDAYLHPTVDSSDESFKWGFPDLDGLRSFFRDELSWNQSKVDDLLLPAIRKMGQRAQSSAVSKQGVLDPFFETSHGSEAFAPRRRDAYASKRLQQVVSDFRKRKVQQTSPASVSSESDVEGARAKKKVKGKTQVGRSRNLKGRKGPKARRSKDGSTSHLENQAGQEDQENSSANVKRNELLLTRLRPRPKARPYHARSGSNPEDSGD